MLLLLYKVLHSTRNRLNIGVSLFNVPHRFRRLSPENSKVFFPLLYRVFASRVRYSTGMTLHKRVLTVAHMGEIFQKDPRLISS